jgi:hypothetical protein
MAGTLCSEQGKFQFVAAEAMLAVGIEGINLQGCSWHAQGCARWWPQTDINIALSHREI